MMQETNKNVCNTHDKLVIVMFIFLQIAISIIIILRLTTEHWFENTILLGMKNFEHMKIDYMNQLILSS